MVGSQGRFQADSELIGSSSSERCEELGVGADVLVCSGDVAWEITFVAVALIFTATRYLERRYTGR